MCSIDGCEKPSIARGWCSGHYDRWKRTGSPTGSSRKTREERFWAKVDKDIGADGVNHWMWRGPLDRDGYGHFYMGRIDGRHVTVPAHRASYAMFVSVVPSDLTIDHLCKVRSCVNPDHLEPVTNTENVARGEHPSGAGHYQRRKAHCPHGHEYTTANTLFAGTKDYRICRICKAARERARRVRD